MSGFERPADSQKERLTLFIGGNSFMSGLSNVLETFQASRPHRRRSRLPAAEGLDQRALLARASSTLSQQATSPRSGASLTLSTTAPS